MKYSKHLTLIIIMIAAFAASTTPAFAVDLHNEGKTVAEYLEDNGVCVDDNTKISIMIKDDDTQYLKVIRTLENGLVEVTYVTAYNDTEDGLVNTPIVNSSENLTTNALTSKNNNPNTSGKTVCSFLSNVQSCDSSSPSVCSSTSVPIYVNPVSITVTLTSYYTSYYLWGYGMRYTLSGLTAKWARSSGSNTVSYMNAYMAVYGDLYYINNNLTLYQSNYSYYAEINQANPTMNVIYTDNETLPSGKEIEPYFTGLYQDPIMGFEITVNGSTYNYSVSPF